MGAPKPWTNDYVFQNTYFCNVHREDDKTTKWIRKNYSPHLFQENYELAICSARIFNWTETLNRIGHVFEPHPSFNIDHLRNVLEMMQRSEWKIWSAAYVITTHGRKMPKIDYCIEILEAASKKLPFLGVTCQDYQDQLMKLEGFGSFLSAQVVADLKNTPDHWLFRAPDWTTFSAPGPGSMRGLGWYFDCKLPMKMYHDSIEKVASDLEWQFCMQDLQNCLCEFDKYCRVLTGVGRSKRNYAGMRQIRPPQKLVDGRSRVG